MKCMGKWGCSQHQVTGWPLILGLDVGSFSACISNNIKLEIIINNMSTDLQ